MERKLKDGLANFCQLIAGAAPVAVHVEPEPWAVPDRCFPNVRRKVDAVGGSMQLGWIFLHGPVEGTTGFLVAVHHAVWKSHQGNLLDVTPNADVSVLEDEGRVLFLPDDMATLEKPPGFEIGLARPSQFFPLSKNRKVAERIREGRQLEWANWQLNRTSRKERSTQVKAESEPLVATGGHHREGAVEWTSLI